MFDVFLDQPLPTSPTVRGMLQQGLGQVAFHLKAISLSLLLSMICSPTDLPNMNDAAQLVLDAHDTLAAWLQSHLTHLYHHPHQV